MERRILVFAKEPVAGQVKTRLAQSLGDERAAALYRAFLADTLATCTAVPDADTTIVFAPPSAQAAFERLAPETRLEPQTAGDIGERMRAAFEAAFVRAPGPVLLIGSDAPHIGAAVLGQAFELLEQAPLVLAPTLDGGYHLIGLTAPQPGLFEGVPWSTSDVLTATLGRSVTLGLEVRLLPQDFDVDEVADLDRLAGRIARDGSGLCPATAAELKKSRPPRA